LEVNITIHELQENPEKKISLKVKKHAYGYFSVIKNHAMEAQKGDAGRNVRIRLK
jgi:hypothetical protein